MTAPRSPLDVAVESLQRGIQEQWDGWLTVSVEEAQTLLSVCKAAVLVRREAAVETTHVESRCLCVRCQRMRAFDAAAAGGER